jgi:hypothetical protein
MTTSERRYIAQLEKAGAEVLAFLEREKDNAQCLINLDRLCKRDMDDEVYRSAAYFVNREWKRKKDSIPTIINAFERLAEELPPATKETAIEQIRYRFRVYTQLLQQGGW